MATTVTSSSTSSSVWGKPGAWALDSEENEEELNRQIQTHTLLPEPEFPSLLTAATVKPTKKKNNNKKGTTLSLGAFNTGSYAPPKPAAFEPTRLTVDEMSLLPTGPRERSAEELDRSRGFRSYGGGERERSERGGERREREVMGPSRADEVDDWSKGKRFGGGFVERSERREKVGFFGSSRADEVDNWGANKSFNDPPRRERERRGVSFGSGGGAEAETWGRRENGGGGERPRLNLQKRTLPVVSIEVNEEGKKGEEREKLEIVRVKGVNPFGEARPREEVLKEKGKDWKEIDEKLEAVKIKEKEKVVMSEERERDGERFGGGGGRRRGFGLGKGENGEERSVRSWRKDDSNGAGDHVAAAAAAAPSSEETSENGAETLENDAEPTENIETTENAAEEN